jgi:hypothetical protein
MWRGKRNGGTLFARMSKIQRAAEENDKRHRKGEIKRREIIRSTINDKVYSGVHKKIGIIESERGQNGGGKPNKAMKKDEQEIK